MRCRGEQQARGRSVGSWSIDQFRNASRDCTTIILIFRCFPQSFRASVCILCKLGHYSCIDCIWHNHTTKPLTVFCSKLVSPVSLAAIKPDLYWCNDSVTPALPGRANLKPSVQTLCRHIDGVFIKQVYTALHAMFNVAWHVRCNIPIPYPHQVVHSTDSHELWQVCILIQAKHRPCPT